MTNYNGRLDEQLNYLMEYSYKYGRCEIPSSENPPLIIARQAKQAITSLMKELVAKAKPERRGEPSPASGYYAGGNGPVKNSYQVFSEGHNAAIDQFEQNLLKELRGKQ